MVRIRLGADDVANIKFGHSAVWETAASLYTLTSPASYSVHRALRRQLALTSLETVRALCELTRVPGWIPDSLAPQPDAFSADPLEQLAKIRDTPTHLIEGDLEVLRRALPLSMWAQMSEYEFVDRLATLMSDYWCAELASRWEVIETVSKVDASRRQRGVARDGIGAALRLLHPNVSYDDSVLSVDMAGHQCKVDGTGEGVWLVPSVFRWPRVGVSAEGPGPIVLSYPAYGAGTIWDDRKPVEQGVAALIGRSRAAVLDEVGVPRTTTALARRLDLAPATVSAHLSTLAAAGLVRGTRDGRLVHYSRTSLGTRLLSQAEATDELA